MHGLQLSALLGLTALQAAFVCASPAPVTGAPDIDLPSNNTNATEIEAIGTQTPFYFGQEAAYRWMGTSRDVLKVAEFRAKMDECTFRLVESMPAGTNMDTPYPEGKYVCDLTESNEYFSMHDVGRRGQWLTYKRIMDAMQNIIKCAEWYQGRKVYYNLFELWTPPENPSQKRVQGVWLQTEPGRPLKFNETTYATA